MNTTTEVYSDFFHYLLLKKDIIIIMVFIVNLTLTRSHKLGTETYIAIPLVEGPGTFGIVVRRKVYEEQ